MGAKRGAVVYWLARPLGTPPVGVRFPDQALLHLKSQVVSLQTAHSWADAGVLSGDACIGSGVAFEAIKLLG